MEVPGVAMADGSALSAAVGMSGDEYAGQKQFER
jgi:hypothetical protein